MTTFKTSIIVGVFSNDAQAKQAVDALRNAGFAYDQVGVAMKDAPNATPSLHDDLMKLGVSHDTASFYEHQYREGQIVVSVRPDGREQEVREILRQHGALYEGGNATNVGSPSMGTGQQVNAYNSQQEPQTGGNQHPLENENQRPLA